MGLWGTPRRGTRRAPRRRIRTWGVALAAVGTSATLAAGCGAVAQSALVEPGQVPVERDLLSRPGSGLAAFAPVPRPSERPAPTTTVPPARVSSAAAVETRPPAAPTVTTPAPSAPPSTSPPVTAAPPTGSSMAAPAGPPPGAMASASVDSRIDEALAMVRVDWANLLPGWQLEFRGHRDGYQGATFPAERLIQIYVRPSSTPEQIAHVLAHELGHAVDVTYLGDVDRAAFSVLRGRPADAAWWAPDGATDFGWGAGDWAEAFSWWATAGTGPWRSTLGPPPDAITQIAISALVGERTGRLVPGVTVFA